MIRFSKVILVVLDGFGVASPSAGNAVYLADPPFFKELIGFYPTKILQASGPAVGLPWGERGNSEVGHLNMGAGRVVTQELPIINRSISDGSFFKNPALIKAGKNSLDKQSTIHIAGLVGTGSVHSYLQHLHTLLGMYKDMGLSKVVVHVFTDGVDSPARSGGALVQKLENLLNKENLGTIGTVAGRFYAMDKGDHWEQTSASLNAMIKGEGEKFSSAVEAVIKRNKMSISDDMIPPSIITKTGNVTDSTVKPGDSIVFFNFRGDRMMQFLKLFLNQVSDVFITSMTMYSSEFPVEVAFPPLIVKNSLGEVISQQGWSQFRLAESEKHAHITFFFNGHRFEPWAGEERRTIKSPPGSYEDTPQMSAKQLTDLCIQRMKEGGDRFILINYANADLIGHTGDIAAAKKAVLALDESLKRLSEAAAETGWLIVITADHGNIEMMKDPDTGEIDKEHSSNPVPLIFVSPELRYTFRKGLNFDTLAAKNPSGILPDIAPTILILMGVEVPPEMTGGAIDV